MQGGAMLTLTIPNRYKAEDVGAQEGQSRMPVPFWGTATFGSDGSLETEMNSLTALLRVDVSTLPADARALVLTSHYYTDLEGTRLLPRRATASLSAAPSTLNWNPGHS